ncbi:MAG: hypothetical protein WEB00_12450 [Dehalococcoidia bacterium]
MSTALRWRLLILEAAVIAGLATLSIFCFWAGNFTRDYVRDQLEAQNIFFPEEGDEPVLEDYGGDQVDTGPEAKAYGNEYIGLHLQGIADGQTYSQVSTAARQDPENPELQGQVQTLFRGETLRFVLVSTWGWWELGRYATIAGYVTAFLALVVLGSLLFELYNWRKEVSGTSGTRTTG